MTRKTTTTTPSQLVYRRAIGKYSANEFSIRMMQHQSTSISSLLSGRKRKKKSSFHSGGGAAEEAESGPQIIYHSFCNSCGGSRFRMKSNIQNKRGITCMDMDPVQSRYLLVGGENATLSLYDLSIWGSQRYLDHRRYHHRKQQQQQWTNHDDIAVPNKNTHQPIAQSIPVIPNQRQRQQQQEEQWNDYNISGNYVTTPTTAAARGGHSTSIVNVQWYPVDTGACVSGSMDGSLLVWDTHQMLPVATFRPFLANSYSSSRETPQNISCFHLSRNRITAVAVGSFYDPMIKLVDIRTGSSSHSLIGHHCGSSDNNNNSGVSTLQWAPNNDVVLCSGGCDGTVRLWDIRKPGSRSCISVLNQDHCGASRNTSASSYIRISHQYHPDYSHFVTTASKTSFESTATTTTTTQRKFPHNKQASSSSRRKQQQQPLSGMAPNNYRSTENTLIQSHNGPVLGVSFTPDGHHLVSVGGGGTSESTIHLWDLRGGSIGSDGDGTSPQLVPLRFMAPNFQPLGSILPKKQRQVPILINHNNTTTRKTSSDRINSDCYIAMGSNVYGYSFLRGGIPDAVFEGHLQHVSSLQSIDDGRQIFLSAGKDGIIQTWGKEQRLRQTMHRNHRKKQKTNNNSYGMLEEEDDDDDFDVEDQDSW